jgi:hypothetical protein
MIRIGAALNAQYVIGSRLRCGYKAHCVGEGQSGLRDSFQADGRIAT